MQGIVARCIVGHVLGTERSNNSLRTHHFGQLQFPYRGVRFRGHLACGIAIVADRRRLLVIQCSVVLIGAGARVRVVLRQRAIAWLLKLERARVLDIDG